jgi:hypothetical protein
MGRSFRHFGEPSHVGYAVEVKNPATDERLTMLVGLTDEQQKIAAGAGLTQSCVINGFACAQAAEIAPPGFEYWGGPITAVTAS